MKVVYFNGGGADYMAKLLLEGFNLLRRDGTIEFVAMNPLSDPAVDTHDMDAVGEKGCLDKVDWADLIIFDTSGGLEWISESVKKIWLDRSIRNSKIVFIDGTDSMGFIHDPDSFLAYFKRECRYPNWMFNPTPLVRSLSFGIMKNLLDAERVEHRARDASYYQDEYDRRDIDISFIAQNTCGLRAQFAQFLDTLKQHNPQLNVDCRLVGVSDMVPSDEYYDVLRRSKISLSLPGVGIDTLRYWEIPACGAVLCSYDITYRIFIRNGYEPNRHQIVFESPQNLGQQLSYIIPNKPLWCMMRRAADICSLHHTSYRRALDVLNMSFESKMFNSEMVRGAIR